MDVAFFASTDADSRAVLHEAISSALSRLASGIQFRRSWNVEFRSNQMQLETELGLDYMGRDKRAFGRTAFRTVGEKFACDLAYPAFLAA